jgi:hypothetical protein
MGAAFRMYLLHLDITQVECLFRVPVEQAASQAIATVLTSTEVMVCFSLPGAVRLCTGADWHGFAGGARVAAGAHDGDSFPRVDGGAQQLTVDRPDPGVAGQCREFDARGYAQHHREQLPRRDALPVPRADESAHRSPREGRGLLDAGCDWFCYSTSQVTAVLSHAQAAQTPLQPRHSLHPSPSSS